MKFESVDELLISVASLSCLVLLIMYLLKKLHQPYLIAYILTGIMIGPSCLGIITDANRIMILGEIGILLHLFFLGTEIEIPDSRSALIAPVIIQTIKIILSGIAAYAIGSWLGWSTSAKMCLCCILIFNSTAIASEYLSKTKGNGSILGKATLNVLVLQDLIFGPILVSFQLFYQKPFDGLRLGLSIVGLLIASSIILMARRRRKINIPLVKVLEGDHDIQVFFGFAICATFALLSSHIGLTASFEGFIAGILISRTRDLSWLENMLKPYYVFFMCLFFLSMGLSMDIHYILFNYKTTVMLAITILVINSTFSMLAFRLLKFSWRDSFYGGSLMSQIGEYSLLVSTAAYQLQAITIDLYKDIICTSGLTILLSTIWITVLRAFIFREKSFLRMIWYGKKKMIIKDNRIGY